MQEQYQAIGETAGKIYRTLEQTGAQTAAVLQKEIKETNTALFHQALGWLSREGKLLFEKSGRTLRVSLAPTQVSSL